MCLNFRNNRRKEKIRGKLALPILLVFWHDNSMIPDFIWFSVLQFETQRLSAILVIELDEFIWWDLGDMHNAAKRICIVRTGTVCLQMIIIVLEGCPHFDSNFELGRYIGIFCCPRSKFLVSDKRFHHHICY